MPQPNNPDAQLLPQTAAESQGLAQEPTEGQSLGGFSPGHAKWKFRKADADKIAALCAEADDGNIRKQAAAIAACMEVAHLQGVLNLKTGEQKRRLLSWKCRNRHCPVCQSVRCTKLHEKFKEALTEIGKHEPDNTKSAFLMLTVTVQNCPVTELRKTLADMGKAWQRLLKLKEFKIVRGWIRGTEVTKGKDGPMMAHPHYHALLLVPPSYFGKHYIKQARWVELWQKAARLGYIPSVDIRRVKTTEGGIEEAVKTATYSVKPEEFKDDREWFYEFHRQVSSLRFLATGGIVKAVLHELAKSNDPELQILWEYLFPWNRPKQDFLHKRMRDNANDD